MNEDDELERLLRAEALRPQDLEFTQRVLKALPPRSTGWLRASIAPSFVLSTRVAFVLALIAAAQRWYSTGSGTVASVLVFLLIAVPVIAALTQLCGPLIPRSLWQFVWRAGRHWKGHWR